MQDKEFDQLFRSKLEKLEMEPSQAVWQGVNDGLGHNQRKKLLPFLSIAASIIVLIAAGVFFIPKKTAVVKPHVNDHAANVKTLKPLVPVAVNTTPVVAAVAPVISAKREQYKRGKNLAPSTKDQAMIDKKSPSLPAVNDKQVLAAAISSKTEVRPASVIDSSATLAAVKPTAQNAVTIAAVPDKQTAAVPPVQKTTDAPVVKKHGIHGLGDILNVVVAAVDKRKDKIIEFGDSDGDGATVTGVNLGPIKVKKEN